MFQGKQKLILLPESYVLISDNELLKEKLQTKLKKDVFLVEKNSLNINYSQNLFKKMSCEFVFDNNHIDFKEIIQIIQSKENKNNTFKILPQTTDFLIGSDNSNDRGEVILISDFKN